MTEQTFTQKATSVIKNIAIFFLLVLILVNILKLIIPLPEQKYITKEEFSKLCFEQADAAAAIHDLNNTYSSYAVHIKARQQVIDSTYEKCMSNKLF